MSLPGASGTVIAVERGREFWRDLLVAGGPTAIPRWTPAPATGVGTYDARISDELQAALRRMADEMSMPLGSVLLTAHARVLGALSGESEVSTGYDATAGGVTLPCRLTTAPRSWRELLLSIHREKSALLSYRELPVEELRRELGLTRPS